MIVVDNSNKADNHLSPKSRDHKKDHGYWSIGIQVVFRYRHEYVVGLNHHLSPQNIEYKKDHDMCG